MNEAGRHDAAAAPPDQAAGADALIASLRAAGAARFDPVRWRHVEALAERAAAHRPSVRRLLDARLAHALAAFNERFESARRDAADAAARCAQQHPHAAGELQRLLAEGDFKGLRRFAATLEAGAQDAPLAALVRLLGRNSPEDGDAPADDNAGSRAELKTIKNSRSTWAKLSVDRQVAEALAQAPKNAGPINSHMLALRSLALMRDISPDYLSRFMSYADSLLCLDQGEKEKPAPAKKQPAAKAAKNKSVA